LLIEFIFRGGFLPWQARYLF